MAFRKYPDSPHWFTLGYGMGWIIDVYSGHYLLQHGGGVPGFTSIMAFMPFEGLGVAVLCNTGNTVVPDYLMRNIMDILWGRDPVIPVASGGSPRARGRLPLDPLLAKGLASLHFHYMRLE